MVPCTVECNGENESAIKCAKVVDGVGTCTVTFVPRQFMTLPKVQAHHDKFVQLSEMHADSWNTCKHSKAKVNCGAASVKLFDKEFGGNK